MLAVSWGEDGGGEGCKRCIVWVRWRRRPQATRLASLSHASLISLASPRSEARADTEERPGALGLVLRQMRRGGHVHRQAGCALGVRFRRLYAIYRACCSAAGAKRTGPPAAQVELELSRPCAAGRRVHSEWEW